MAEEFEFQSAAHREYLVKDVKRQIMFFQNSLRGDGGFDTLDYDGKRQNGAQELHTTTRLIHSYALAKTAGLAGCEDMIDAGMNALWQWHRDPKFGGYLWSVDGKTPVDDVKLAYGHVFVLLAASSAKTVAHPDADRLFDDILEVLDTRFWQADYARLQDEFARDWSVFSDYRGMNANMHGVEAYLGAYEATGDVVYLERAGHILDFFTGDIAPKYDWRIPEHFTPDWQVDADYEGNPMFRPRGTTPGHSFELARLLLQYWDLSGREDLKYFDHAKALFERALDDAWDKKRGGFVYTLTPQGVPDKTMRYWWPLTEAIGALASFLKLEENEVYAEWYARLWQFADQVFIDHARGGWYPEIDETNQPTAIQFGGKPDIYHALQATLIPTTNGVSRLFDGLRAQPLV